MPSQARGKLNCLLVEKEGAAHTPDYAGLVEPDKPMLVRPPSRSSPPQYLVYQGEPPTIEGDRLRATPELLGRDGRHVLGDRSRLLVQDAGRVAEIDELQPIVVYERHPVLLVQPRTFRAEHAPIGQPAIARCTPIDAREHLLAPSLRRQLPKVRAAPKLPAPGEEPHVLEAFDQFVRRFGHVGGRQNLCRRLNIQGGIKPE